MTPVASPLRPAYHFWAQDWIEGYKKAVPSPAGMLKARKNPHPAQPGKKAAAEQGCAPQRRAARPLFVLQKTAQHTPHPKGGNKQGKGVTRPLLRKAVFLHDRLLKDSPRRR